jgi:hypothetical protein
MFKQRRIQLSLLKIFLFQSFDIKPVKAAVIQEIFP